MHICSQPSSMIGVRLATLSIADAKAHVERIPACRRCGAILLNWVTSADAMERYTEVTETALKRAVEIARQTATRDQLVMTLGVAAEVLSIEKEYQAAEQLYREAANLASEHSPSHPALGSLLLNLANVQQDSGQLEAALTTLKQAHQVYTHSHDFQGRAEVLANLGNIYHDLGDYQAAISVRRESLDLYDILRNTAAKIEGWSSLALVYMDSGDTSSAMSACQLALALIEEGGGSGHRAQALNNLGTILMSLGERERAAAVFAGALAAASRAGDDIVAAAAAQNLATAES